MPIEIIDAKEEDGLLRSVRVKVEGIATPMVYDYERGAWFKSPDGERCDPTVEARLTTLWMAFAKARGR